MEINKILWPTDFSPNADWALDHVTSLSQLYEAEIHVLHVVPNTGAIQSPYGDDVRSHSEKVVTSGQQVGEERLEQICSRDLNGCPLYIRHVAVGDPAQEILAVIEKEGIDIVVMATQGETDHFQFGSVAEKVMRNSDVPVVLIPSKSADK